MERFNDVLPRKALVPQRDIFDGLPRSRGDITSTYLLLGVQILTLRTLDTS